MKTKLLQFSAAILIFFLGSDANAQSWKLIGNSGTTPGANFLGTTDNKTLQFKTNNKLRMIIKNNGPVGIGTSTPVGQLNIDGGSYLSLSGGGYQVIGNVTSYNLAFDPYNIQGRNNGGALSISINAFGGSTYLGNETGSYYGAVGYGYNYGFYGETSSGIGVYGISSTGTGVYGYASTSGGSNSRGVNAYGNYGLYATTADNAAYYAGFFVGDVYSSGIYAGSDEKLKQNIRDVTSAMQIIGQLHPKIYQFRQDGNYKLMNLPQGQHYGLIAQDVEKILPYMVKTSKFDAGKAKKDSKTIADTKNPDAGAEADKTKAGEVIDFKALNYTEFIPIMIKGMQEQQQTIQSLQQIVEQQQQQINQLLAANVSSSKAVGSDVSGASLLQNAPNPFSSNTVIRCNVPSTAKQAQLQVYSSTGNLLKTYPLNTKGMNQVIINGGTLSSGQYAYSLSVDGKMVESKNMILTK